MVLAPASLAPCTTLSPTPPQPTTSTLTAGLDVGVAHHGADAGRHAAADDGGVCPGQILAHGDDLLGGADHVLGERADARHLVDRLAVELHARGAVVHAPARRVVMARAQHRAALRAVAAVAAVGAEREDDVVALLDVAHAGAELDDDAGRLVTQHHGQRQRPVAVHDVPVAHAHAGGLHLHAHLAGLRALLLQVEQLQGLVDFGQHGGAHGRCLLGRRSGSGDSFARSGRTFNGSMLGNERRPHPEPVEGRPHMPAVLRQAQHGVGVRGWGGSSQAMTQGKPRLQSVLGLR